MKKVFIDGKAGTTGLRIEERLSARDDLQIISLPEELRKDPAARKQMLNEADFVFLCLPDDAAREAVSMIENEATVVIDASTAHRTDPAWAYGFPELSKAHERKILNSNRIAVPGCHASGFIALVYPLIEKRILGTDALLTAHSLTGYSGGGKKMIADYESEGRNALLNAPRQYALAQTHKHLPEMTKICGLKNAPVFSPIVGDFYSGMEVAVPLFVSQLQKGANLNTVKAIYQGAYASGLVQYKEGTDESGFLSAGALTGKDDMEISVYGNDERILLTARYDNLGKGASGAAVECLNLKLGCAREKSLVL